MIRKMKIANIVFWLALLAFTVYFLMDTFVIERVYQTETGSIEAENYSSDDSSAAGSGGLAGDSSADTIEGSSVKTGSLEAKSYSSDDSAAAGSNEASDGTSDKTSEGSSGSSESSNDGKSESQQSTAIITENSYKDENISIEISEYRINDTTVYAADVQLSSPEYLKTALAKASYGKNVTAKTSDTAASVNAILAINGDYYGAQEKGYVIKNSVIYRSTAVNGKEDLAIYKDGSFEIIVEGQVSAQELVNRGVVNLLSFGPALVEDGQVSVGVSDEVGKAKASNPRTAIGIIDDCHYIFVVSDGRTSESEGLSLYELAQVMQQLGAKTAYNLDGGGSSTMWFNGALVNNPTTNGSIKERSVSDIVYVGL